MADELLKRVMPNNVEAEQSVIGAMLMDRDAITIASEILTVDDFYQKQYGILFEAMVELYTENVPVDLITLQNRLKEKDVPPEISSLEFVRDMITKVPTSVNVGTYAKIVSEKAALRRLIRVNEEIASACYAGKDSVEEIMEDTEKKIFQVLQRKTNDEFVPIKDVVLNALDKIEAASQDEGKRYRNADRLYRSGLQNIRLPAVGSDSDRGPSFYGKDGIRVEYCRIYGVPQQ